MPKKIEISRALADFLIEQVPKFDEAIMADIRPTGGWELIPTGEQMYLGSPEYLAFMCREDVRRICEGDSFLPTKMPKLVLAGMPAKVGSIPMGTPVNITKDRFRFYA